MLQGFSVCVLRLRKRFWILRVEAEWQLYRILVLFFKSVPNFCVLAVCANWLVMQGVLFSTEIHYAMLNRQFRGVGQARCAPACGPNTAIPVLYFSVFSFYPCVLLYFLNCSVLSRAMLNRQFRGVGQARCAPACGPNTAIPLLYLSVYSWVLLYFLSCLVRSRAVVIS